MGPLGWLTIGPLLLMAYLIAATLWLTIWIMVTLARATGMLGTATIRALSNHPQRTTTRHSALGIPPVYPPR